MNVCSASVTFIFIGYIDDIFKFWARQISYTLSFSVDNEISLWDFNQWNAFTYWEITRQICAQMCITILKGVLGSDHVHMFVEILPKYSVSDVMKRIKGCTSRKIQQEFPELRKRYWGRRFWARGFFCTIAGLVTNEVILNYIEKHS